MEVEDAEEVEDKDSGVEESCLARKLASLGIAVHATIHLSEYKAKTARSNLSLKLLHIPINVNSCCFHRAVTKRSYL